MAWWRVGRVGTALAVAAVLCALPGVASAQTPGPASEGGQVLLVMDSSGSMAGPDGTGKTKIDAAKAAIDRAVDVAPPTGQLGLRVYGAALAPDAGGACQDTRLAVPVGTGNRPALRAGADGLTPRGQTPIGYSLQQAADDFTRPGPREILLVSDGIETCGADPCTVARQLAAQGVDLRIDVVGFQVDQAARDQLRCVADAGHGTYSDAGDGTALQSVVGRTSARALREYRPGGTPVTGTADPVPAPVLTPGQYLDAMPDQSNAPNAPGTPKWYGFDRRGTETVYVSATVVPPVAPMSPTNDADHVFVEIDADDGTTCGGGDAIDFSVGGGETFSPVTATGTLSSSGSPAACDHPGRFHFSVKGVAGQVPFPRMPVEIQVLSEPPATDVASLPPADTSTGKLAAPTASGPGTPVAGSARFTDAPTVGPGTWDDAILPGETLFYRVRLDWGQRLVARLDTAVPPGFPESATGNLVRVRTFGPNRGEARRSFATDDPGAAYVAAEPRTTGAATPQVRYRNRGESRTLTANASGVENAALAGYYYVGVHMRTTASRIPVEAPFHLTVAVVGQPSGAPAYQDVGGAPDPGRQQDAAPAGRPGPDGGGSAPTGTVLVVVLGAVAVLVIGGVVVGVGLRRRRRLGSGARR